MKTCRELLDFLMAYLDGELPAEQRRLFEEHLSVCSQCETYLETYKKTIELAAESCRGTDELPDVPEELVQAILAAKKGRKP